MLESSVRQIDLRKGASFRSGRPPVNRTPKGSNLFNLKSSRERSTPPHLMAGSTFLATKLDFDCRD